MSAGRKGFLERNRGDKQELERFKLTIEDVLKGKTPLKVAAKGFGMSPKQFRRYMDSHVSSEEKAATYASYDKWDQIPRVADWAEWLKSRAKTPAGEKNMVAVIPKVQRIWAEVFGKKNPSLWTDSDMVKVTNWINALKGSNGQDLSQDTKRGYFQALRFFVRFGFGNRDWLDQYLWIKGRKAPPRMPPELKTESSFHAVMPRLYKALGTMLEIGDYYGEKWRGKLDLFKFESQHMVLHLKSKLQVRTGRQEYEQELWGTVINNPHNDKTSLLVDQNGKVQHWTVTAKGNEVWEIPRAAFETEPGLVEEVEEYIRKNGLKTGDFLLKNFDVDDSRLILKRQAEIAGLTHYILHDMRKISATNCVLAGLTVEETANFGVGWKDTNTLVKHYIAIKGLNLEKVYTTLKNFNTAQAAPKPEVVPA